MEKARTHDVSLVDYHVKDLDTFGQTLTKAALAAFPVDGQSRYKEVHVLLLSWNDDNLGVISEIEELQNVFRLTYNYATEVWRIPSHRAHTSLGKRIAKFIDNFESSKSLLIVYYGGHGHMNDDRQCVWSCKGTPGCATVQWFGLQTMLEQADSDVLILLDYRAAASSAAESGSRVTEVVAACGFETWTPGVCEHSFTRGLIEELKYWSQGPPLSVAMLHNKILSRMKYWKPRYGISGCGMTRHPELGKTPIYIVLGNEREQRSIEINPLKLDTSLVSDHLRNASLISPTELPTGVEPMTGDVLMGSVGDTNETHLECNPDSLTKVWPDAGFECPKVLISLALERDQWLRTDAWAEWLRQVPAVVKYAHVDGVYESDSKLVLCSVPVAIWDLIPSDPAIKFIAFIKSGNLLTSTRNGDAETKASLNDQALYIWPQQDATQKGKESLWSQDENRPLENLATVGSSTDSIASGVFSSLEGLGSASGSKILASESGGKGGVIGGLWIWSHCTHLNNTRICPVLCANCPHRKCGTCTTLRK